MNLFRFFACGALLVSTAFLFGCGEDGTAVAGVSLDAHRTLGEPVTAGNLTVWPVYTDEPLDIGEFLTLSEAQARKVAVIREVGGAPTNAQTINITPSNDAGSNDADSSDAGSNDVGNGAQARQGQVVAEGDGAVVNTLVIENTGGLPILVCAGTIVDGGKQDRQIGQDFVIEANTKVDVDAFCVEHGRWAGQEINPEGAIVLEFASFGAVAPKSVRMSGQYNKSQQEVWAKVAENLDACDVSVQTGSLLANVEKADKKVLKQRADLEARIAAHFEKLAGSKSAPVGFAYAINGKPVTVRAFAHSRILKGQLPAFLKAMAIEADVAKEEAAKGFEPATAQAVVALVAEINAATEKLVETGAANDNGYREGKLGFNARCYWHATPAGGGGAGHTQRVTVSEDWTSK